MRVSTGGSIQLDTIKAFVEEANRNQMEQLKNHQLDMQSCTIQQAEFTAQHPGFKLPLQDALGQTGNGLINISVPANGLYGKNPPAQSYSQTQQFAKVPHEDQIPHMQGGENYHTFHNTHEDIHNTDGLNVNQMQ